MIRICVSVIFFILPFVSLAHQGNQQKLTPVQVEKKWGYIDESGNIAITPSFDYAEPFSEGLAAVAINDSPETGNKLTDTLTARFKWGFINEKGQIVITPQYSAAGSFSEGLARVRIESNLQSQWGYINVKGETVIKPEFAYAEDFKNGRAAVGRGKFIIRWPYKGVTVIELHFDGKHGFIDRNGKFTRAAK
jgi:hypothetical protein